MEMVEVAGDDGVGTTVVIEISEGEDVARAEGGEAGGRGGEGNEAAVALQENERGLRSRAVGAEDEVGAVVAIEVNGEEARGVEGREGEVGGDVGDGEGPRRTGQKERARQARYGELGEARKDE